MSLSPTNCPKFISCSAPVCPFYDRLAATSHAPGDAVCLYLREYVKTDGPARLLVTLGEDRLKAVATLAEAIMALKATDQARAPGMPGGLAKLRYALERAAHSPSKIATAGRLKAA